MKKNRNSPMKKEPRAKQAKAQRTVQRETKEVPAELVEKLRGKLELNATPASVGEAGERPELSPNRDRLTVGVDLGDQFSRYCILDLQGETLSEGALQTRPAEVAEFFQSLTPARVVIEVGTHSPWMEEIIASKGHEVLRIDAGKAWPLRQESRRRTLSGAGTQNSAYSCWNSGHTACWHNVDEKLPALQLILALSIKLVNLSVMISR